MDNPAYRRVLNVLGSFLARDPTVIPQAEVESLRRELLGSKELSRIGKEVDPEELSRQIVGALVRLACHNPTVEVIEDAPADSEVLPETDDEVLEDSQGDEDGETSQAQSLLRLG